MASPDPAVPPSRVTGERPPDPVATYEAFAGMVADGMSEIDATDATGTAALLGMDPGGYSQALVALRQAQRDSVTRRG